MDAFDYIIVGAGSAGCVLANRLSADPAARVLLIEAGGPDRSPWIHLPIGYGKAFYDGRINWKFMTEPVAGMNGRPSYWPRGKVLGGSSSINAMVYVRGHATDFNDWRAAGADGWGWDDVAPAFRAMENWDGPDPDGLRGADGPLPVADTSRSVHPLTSVWRRAMEEAGPGWTDDYNAARMEGGFLYQITTRGGRRASTARAYLRPAMKRPNLTVLTRAHAKRILFEGRRAAGLVYRRAGREETARARREVILSAGAVGSPHLLMLSGVGPGAALQAADVAPLIDNPHVGRNLQDHTGADLHYRARVRTLNQTLRPWAGRALVGARWLLTRGGPLSLSINQAGAFVRTNPALAAPDHQLYFTPVSYTRAPPGKRPMLTPDPYRGFMMGFSLCRPKSAGEIALAGPDPMAPPVIRPNYLDHPDDVTGALRAVRYIRALAQTRALSGIIEAEAAPGPDAADDAALEDFIRAESTTIFHPSCTARMGRDPAQSVVDPRLRLHGAEGLRVVDASVFPNVTSGNINAPVIMVAERAAGMILKDARG